MKKEIKTQSFDINLAKEISIECAVLYQMMIEEIKNGDFLEKETEVNKEFYRFSFILAEKILKNSIRYHLEKLIKCGLVEKFRPKKMGSCNYYRILKY